MAYSIWRAWRVALTNRTTFMNRALRVLFVLHEGVGSTIFSSQVYQHALTMAEAKIEIDVLAYETLKKSREASANNLKALIKRCNSVVIRLKDGVNIFLPFALLINASLFIIYLQPRRKEYSILHARANYTAFLCLLTKPIHRLPVLWDCRGDAVAELRDSLSRKSIFLRATLGWILMLRERFIEIFNRHFADGAIFVSDELAKQHLPGLQTKHFGVIPCPVPEDKFYFDATVRHEMREKYNISSDRRVFIYAGSVVAYQGLVEQLGIYKRVLDSSENLIIFATPDLISARNCFHQIVSERFLIVSVPYEKMNELYNLADFAFMLRQSKKLNWVASPTKFGEYCLTGLPVILNDTVSQASENARSLGNYVHVNDILDAVPLDNTSRYDVAQKAKKIYSRSATSPLYANLYNSATQE